MELVDSQEEPQPVNPQPVNPQGGQRHCEGGDQENRGRASLSSQERIVDHKEVHDLEGRQGVNHLENDPCRQVSEIDPSSVVTGGDDVQVGHGSTHQDPRDDDSSEVGADATHQQPGTSTDLEVPAINSLYSEDRTPLDEGNIPRSVMEVDHQLGNDQGQLDGDGSVRWRSDGRKLSSSNGSEEDFFDAEDQLSLGVNDSQPESEEASKFKTAREGDLLQWEQSLYEAKAGGELGEASKFKTAREGDLLQWEQSLRKAAEAGGGDPQEASKFKTAREGDLLVWEQSLREAAEAKTRAGLSLPDGMEITGDRRDSVGNGKTAPGGETVKTPAAQRSSDLWGTFEPDSVVLVEKNSRGGQKAPVPYKTLSTVSSSTSLVSQQSAPPSSTDWIMFDEGPTKRSHSSMGGVTGPAPTGAAYQPMESGTDWIRFESSPRAKRRQITQQLTGDSLTNSMDAALSSDGRSTEVEQQSMATPSVKSSHGSNSDYLEYFPLDASAASSDSRLPEMPKWSEQRSFEGAPVAPPRRRSGPTLTSISPSEQTFSPPSAPCETLSPTSTSWVKFEDGNLGLEEIFSSCRSSPARSIPSNMNSAEAKLASQATLPSRTILAKDTDIASLLSGAVLQDVTNRLENSANLPFPDPQAVPPSPSPANPFREDILRQHEMESRRAANCHRREGSYNPFKTDIPEEMPQPTSTWQTFSDDFEPLKPAVIPSSPGNPFKFQTHVEFHRPFQQNELHCRSVSRGQPGDESDFAEVPSSPTVLVEIRDPYSPTHGDSRFVQISRTLPTATVLPVVTDSGANALPVEARVPSANGYINEYPRTLKDPEQGWPLMLRYPDKKKWAGSRDWKSVHVRLIEGSLLQFFNNDTETEPFKEIPLQCNYEFTPLKLYPYDAMGKIHTIKLLYTSYKEKWKVSARGFHTRVLVTEQLLKVGSRDYESFRSFVFVVNEALMKLSSFKGSDSYYHNDSITVTVTDSYRNLMSIKGDLLKQSVHVDIYMLAFLSGKADCAIGLNDIQVKGTEVVSKREIIPNKTTQWIKMENIDLHKCCNKNVFVESRFITFDPMDACRFKLLSFDVRPKTNPELPLLVKAALSGEDVHFQFRVDLLVPARGPKQEPHHYICYDIMIRIPVPPSLINYFRYKKRIGFSHVKASHKTAEQIKKPRIKPNLLEVSVGSAKYEHAFEAIVWRIDKLPEKISAVPATHLLLCTLNLTSGRNYSAARLAIPSEFQNEVKVDYRTHHTTASNTTVRSLAVDSKKSPDKIIRYSAQYEYTVLVDNKYAMGPMADGIDSPQCAQQ